MPYFKTSQEWLDQSALLIEARPTTTRVTTKYVITAVLPRPAATKSESESEPAAAAAPRGAVVLKTYCPRSGVTLKYRTTKAAEVSRLVYAALGRLGRAQAAVKDVPEETMTDAPEVEQPVQPPAGGKKKKKGKR